MLTNVRKQAFIDFSEVQSRKWEFLYWRDYTCILISIKKKITNFLNLNMSMIHTSTFSNNTQNQQLSHRSIVQHLKRLYSWNNGDSKGTITFSQTVRIKFWKFDFGIRNLFNYFSRLSLYKHKSKILVSFSVRLSIACCCRHTFSFISVRTRTQTLNNQVWQNTFFWVKNIIFFQRLGNTHPQG